MVLGGSFTTASPSGSGTVINTPYVLAFDATTGAINTGFQPGVNKPVNAVLPGPTREHRLRRRQLHDGGRPDDQGPDAGQPEQRLAGRRLHDAGHERPHERDPARRQPAVRRRNVHGRRRSSSAGGSSTLNATTGAVDTFMTSKVTVNHNWTEAGGGAKAAVGVKGIDVTPDGTRSSWRSATSSRRRPRARPGRDVGHHRRDRRGAGRLPHSRLRGGLLLVRVRHVRPRHQDLAGRHVLRDRRDRRRHDGNCDTQRAGRSTRPARTSQDTWASYAGGDSMLSVAITGPVVYAGGHQRWMNNPNGNDFAGPGAVPRPGLAALDAATGMPRGVEPRTQPAWIRRMGAARHAGRALDGQRHDVYIGPVVQGGREVHPQADRVLPARRWLAAGVRTRSRRCPAGIYLGGSTSSSPERRAPARELRRRGDREHRRRAGLGTATAGEFANTGNTAGWSAVPNVDATVPASTPRAIFDSERWDDGGAPEMQLTLPVPAGRQHHGAALLRQPVRRHELGRPAACSTSP